MNVEQLQTAVRQRLKANGVRANTQRAQLIELEFLAGVFYVAQLQGIQVNPAVVMCALACRSILTL